VTLSDVSATFQRNWRRQVEEHRAMLRAVCDHPLSSDASARARAEYLISQAQALAFNLVVAPRPESPRFFTHLAADPSVYTWGLSDSTIIHYIAQIDIAKRYVVYGDVFRWDLDSLVMVDLDGLMQFVATGQLEKAQQVAITMDPNAFRVELGGACEGADVHREFPRQARWLILRRWAPSAGSKVGIAPLEEPPPITAMDGVPLLNRLQAAATFSSYLINASLAYKERSTLRSPGINSFGPPWKSFGGECGQSAYFSLADDETLLIEMSCDDYKQWRLRSTDCWGQVVNYIDYQSSIDQTDIRVDDDGIIRIVVSPTDEGAFNWLSTVAFRQGGCELARLDGRSFEISASSVNKSDLDRMIHAGRCGGPIAAETRNKMLAARRSRLLDVWDY